MNFTRRQLLRIAGVSTLLPVLGRHATARDAATPGPGQLEAFLRRPATLLLRNVRPMGGTPVDVLVRDGRIAQVGTALRAPAGTPGEDGRGALLLPGLVEGHSHIDKTMWGMEWYHNAVGNQLTDRIENERAFRDASGHDARAQSMVLAKAFLAMGTTRLRTHVDVDTQAGLKHLEGVMHTREVLRELQQIQIVAFPQSGLLARPGTAELLDRAMATGADVVGGLDPSNIDGDPVRSLDTLFDIAARHDKPLDIHLHEMGSLGAFSLRLILDRTEALGMQGRVVVSHCFCLGDLPDAQRTPLLERMARLGVAIATTAPPIAIPPLMACRAAGVTVMGGNDGIRDTWGPYGNPDMLRRAMLIGMRFGLRRDEDIAVALDCVTWSGARGCHFADYGLDPGNRADLVLVDAQTVAQAVVDQPVRRLVVAAGRIVARNGVLESRLAGI